ncbi:MAG: helix-hairpin-helix domain-containing protein [Bacteroidota bacterium]
MDPIKRLREFFAFTKNEQNVFLFLSVVFLAGVAVKVYKTYIVPQAPAQYDYTVSDSVFNARSRALSGDSASTIKKQTGKIDLNAATKTELMELPGIGEAMAERILVYRKERGSIKTIGELKKIKGIGEKKFEKLKPHIEVK